MPNSFLRFPQGLIRLALIAALPLATMTPAAAATFTFNGTFKQDDNVQLLRFTTDGLSNIVFQSFSYAGGVNATGQVIPSGGFDPILTVFNSTGQFFARNTLPDPGFIATDPVTGRASDIYLSLPLLPAGPYTAAITQFDNVAIGPNLSDGFTEQGTGNFTGPQAGVPGGSFYDFSGTPFSQRTTAWELDIRGATTAMIPEPGSLTLARLAMAALFLQHTVSTFFNRRST